MVEILPFLSREKYKNTHSLIELATLISSLSHQMYFSRSLEMSYKASNHSRKTWIIHQDWARRSGHFQLWHSVLSDSTVLSLQWCRSWLLTGDPHFWHAQPQAPELPGYSCFMWWTRGLSYYKKIPGFP